MKKLIVTSKYNNKKLNKFLQDNFPSLTTSLFYKTLKKKDIKINGKRISENINIYEKDEIIVYIDDKLLFPEYSFNIEIVYEDNNIIILNKPSNLEVTGTNSLTSLIHKKYSNCEFLPMPCHRLDRNTTGLIIFAKNKTSLDILEEKFKNHEIEKHYLALVYGVPKIPKRKLESYLFKDSSKSLVYISDTPKKGYSKIITSYTLLEKYSNNTSLLDVEIETGKTHQIRAHLSHIGLPIIGDGKYGINKINKEFHSKYQKLSSYIIKFNFTTPSDILDYLNNKEISIDILF